MLNVQITGVEPYEAADLLSWSFKEKILYLFETAINLFEVILKCFPIFLIWLKELFVGRRKKSIRGWTVLITGGAHGIGKALCEKFGNVGCNVAVADIDVVGAKIVAKELTEKGIKAIAYKVDVTDYRRLLKLKEEIERDMGSVDILVNNAALITLLSLRDGVKEDIDRIISVNLTSIFYTTRIFIKGMLERKRGHIVTMCSAIGVWAGAGACMYTATKYGVNGFVTALEQELRLQGHEKYIHFTTVYPYFVATRKCLIDAINLRIPAITPNEAAKKVLDGVLENNRIVFIPKLLRICINIYKILPYKLQNLIRDHMLRESEIGVCKLGENYLHKQ